MTRPKRITLSPTALDRNGISASQNVAANGHFTIAGDLATSLAEDRDGIATAQTPAAAGALTLDGASAYGVLSTPTYITIYAAGDESGKTFNVHGIDGSGNKLVETITGPNATTVVGSTRFYAVTNVFASAATAGDVEVGFFGIAAFATPQHVTAYAAGDESGDTITVTGLDRKGELITDTITGVNASTVATTANFSKVLKVKSSGAVTGMEIGVDGTCDSGWVPLNRVDFNGVALGVVVSSAATCTVQHTFDDVFATTFTEDGATTFNHDSLAAITASDDGNYTVPVSACRLSVTSYTSGTVGFNVIDGS